MATATTLQLLDSVAGDGTTSLGITPSNRRQIEMFISSAAIVAGDAVSFDTRKADGDKTLYVLKASTGAVTSKCFVGIALDTATAAEEKVRVCIAGFCEANIKAGECASAGLNLMIETTGLLQDYAAGSVLQNSCISCEARRADGKAKVIVFKQF